MNMPSLEPRNGDFVAYLAEIEQRQVAAMHSPEPPKFTAHPAEIPAAKTPNGAGVVVPPTRSAMKPKSDWVGPLILTSAAVFLIGVSLIDNGGPFPALIGAFLLWRALRLFNDRKRPASTTSDKK